MNMDCRLSFYLSLISHGFFLLLYLYLFRSLYCSYLYLYHPKTIKYRLRWCRVKWCMVIYGVGLYGAGLYGAGLYGVG